jgi:hypothetical protein
MMDPPSAERESKAGRGWRGREGKGDEKEREGERMLFAAVSERKCEEGCV